MKKSQPVLLGAKVWGTKLPLGSNVRGTKVANNYLFLGSAKMAIQVLAKANVRPENIMFLNLICAPEGLKALTDEYPQVQVVTGAIDDCLDENRFIVPGLGDYGDRYYGTEGSI